MRYFHHVSAISEQVTSISHDLFILGCLLSIDLVVYCLSFRQAGGIDPVFGLAIGIVWTLGPYVGYR